MPRPLRADEAGGLYHALNRGNGRSEIFHNPEDYFAFEQVLAEGLEGYDVSLFCYQLMPDHWHLVLRPNVDGELGRFIRWITATHTMRYRARYQTLGEGHVYQGRFKSFPIEEDAHFLTVCRYVERNAVRAKRVKRAEKWQWSSLWRWKQPTEPGPALLSAWPISRLPNWIERVNEPLPELELAAIRKAVQRGTPIGSTAWVQQTASRLGLESTLRKRGRPRVHFLQEADD
jgi:putative transposase